MSDTVECGAHGPPNGWLCRQPKGHAVGEHVYRPTEAQMAQTTSVCRIGPTIYGARLRADGSLK